jgi:hypothetical protein
MVNRLQSGDGVRSCSLLVSKNVVRKSLIGLRAEEGPALKIEELGWEGDHREADGHMPAHVPSRHGPAYIPLRQRRVGRGVILGVLVSNQDVDARQ